MNIFCYFGRNTFQCTIVRCCICLINMSFQSINQSINQSNRFLPRDERSAKRGIAIVSRPSVCLFLCPSVTLMCAEHIGWTSSKLITRSLGATTSAIYSPRGTPLKFGWNTGWGRCSPENCNISETGQDRTKVTINVQ